MKAVDLGCRAALPFVPLDASRSISDWGGFKVVLHLDDSEGRYMLCPLNVITG